MNFFDDGTANGGYMLNRTELHSRIEDLYGRIDDENEKKEELISELARVERAIERWTELLHEMEAHLR